MGHYVRVYGKALSEPLRFLVSGTKYNMDVYAQTKVTPRCLLWETNLRGRVVHLQGYLYMFFLVVLQCMEHPPDKMDI